MKGLEEVERLKKVHARWVVLQSVFGALPLFAIVNKFRPMLDDGYGGDLIPTLLPEPVQPHYNLILGLLLAALAASELLRRRFHARHKEDLSL